MDHETFERGLFSAELYLSSVPPSSAVPGEREGIGAAPPLLTESSGLPEQIAAAVWQSNPALFNSHSSSKQCRCCKHFRTVSPAPFAAIPNPKPSACSGPMVAAACCLPTGRGLPGWPRCAGRCRQGRARQVIYGGTHVRAVGCCCWRGESAAVLVPVLPPQHQHKQ